MTAPTKALSRVISGKKAQENGAIAEGIVEQARHFARLKRMVNVRKVPTPMRFDGSRRAWVPSERSTVDGVGFVMATSNGNEPPMGTFVADEVKSVDVSAGPSVLLSRVETHQRDFLDAVHECGGVAVVTFVLLGVSRDMLSIWRWYDICDETSISIERLRTRAVSVNGYGGEVRACWLRILLRAARLVGVWSGGRPTARVLGELGAAAEDALPHLRARNDSRADARCLPILPAGAVEPLAGGMEWRTASLNGRPATPGGS